jgi:heparan-alpha-glucosaminide N-acetyltransferase
MATTLSPSRTADELEASIGGPPPPPPPRKPGGARLMSLDAYRGFIMIVLAANGFGWHALAKSQHRVFALIANQFDHVEWTGMVFWDLIQPAFMFMVGVAMPFAFASRMRLGATTAQVFRHVAWRSLMLLTWSQVLISIGRGRLQFQLMNVLSQIAFTYFFCFFIMQMKFRWQAVTAALVLAGHWALFVLFPGSQGPFSKGDNIGAVIDHAVGLHNSGYYVTINFISSTVTTLFGVWTGRLLMREDSHAHRVKVPVAQATTVVLVMWYLCYWLYQKKIFFKLG